MLGQQTLCWHTWGLLQTAMLSLSLPQQRIPSNQSRAQDLRSSPEQKLWQTSVGVYAAAWKGPALSAGWPAVQLGKLVFGSVACWIHHTGGENEVSGNCLSQSCHRNSCLLSLAQRVLAISHLSACTAVVDCSYDAVADANRSAQR